MESFASDCFSYCEARSLRANCRSEAAAMRRDCAWRLNAVRKKNKRSNIAEMGRSNAAPLHLRIVGKFFMGALSSKRSDAKNHYFGGFDQGGCAFAWLQAHFFRRIGSDDGGDVLFADG